MISPALRFRSHKATAWNPADAGAGLTVSGIGNLTVTYTGTVSGDYYSVRSTTSHSGGKYYLVFTIGGNSGGPTIGIGNSTFDITKNAGAGYLGGTPFSIGYNANGQVFRNNGTVDATLATFTDGAVIGMAVDLDNSKIWWLNGGLWNNAAIGVQNPATNLGGQPLTGMNGPYFFGFTGKNQLAPADSAVVNLTPASPPSGFGTW